LGNRSLKRERKSDLKNHVETHEIEISEEKKAWCIFTWRKLWSFYEERCWQV